MGAIKTSVFFSKQSCCRLLCRGEAGGREGGREGGMEGGCCAFFPSRRVVYFVAVNKAAVLAEPPGRGQGLGRLLPVSRQLITHVGRDRGGVVKRAAKGCSAPAPPARLQGTRLLWACSRFATRSSAGLLEAAPRSSSSCKETDPAFLILGVDQ